MWPQISRHPTRRGAYQLKTEQWLPRPRSEVFAFFADAFNLESITPPWLNFHVVTPRPIAMSAGTLIEYRLRLHGIPLWWRTEISRWEPPFSFVDQQLRGPYRLWHHLHTFAERDDGTLCTDVVDYAFFGGPLVHSLLVKRDLEAIFHFRSERLEQLLGAASAATT
ncbi:MAG: CDP-paratose 2-epimerase [Planctomycetales bacterium 12-60-4]|nr:MAG: CDP-paratose 2-epimerase [Planctomycetales bacterium 12-60-4]